MAGTGTASSTTPVHNGDNPWKPSHALSNIGPYNEATLAADRTRAYMASFNGGGDPVTALAVRSQSAESSVAERNAEVMRQLQHNLAIVAQEGS
ncbi:hypothetical protein F5Y17DRAFT_463031 [Xylariaceae sp. FL0594]|nr:hypothetical protein F5Y17DRAFT_463031 [Xylariaceae sp. FL0594]